VFAQPSQSALPLAQPTAILHRVEVDLEGLHQEDGPGSLKRALKAAEKAAGRAKASPTKVAEAKP
jgi:hypothetical protein